MMSKFDKVQGYFEAGLWDLSRVKNAVRKSWITAAEYETITGEPFEEGAE